MSDARADRPGGSSRSTAGRPWLLIAALVLVGLNLRGPIVGIPPVISEISEDLELSTAAAGLLTSVPLLCFAVLSPFAGDLARRVGLDRAILLGLFVIALGLALRPWGGAGVMLLGTAAIGMAITVGNVVLPVIVRRDAGRRVNAVMAATTTSYVVGATLAAAVTAPIAALLGWRTAIASWVVFSMLAMAVWLLRMRRIRSVATRARQAAREDSPSPEVSGRRRSVWQEPDAWVLALFFGLQSTLFYTATTWLPALLVDEAGLSTAGGGTAMSVFQVVGIAGPLAVPVLLRWLSSARYVAVLAGLGCTMMFAGLFIAPDVWPVWVVVGGFFQGLNLGLALTLIATRPVDVGYGRGLSAMVQSVGYAISAVGPVLIGAVREMSSGWGPALWILTATAALYGLVGLWAGSDRLIGSGPTGP